MHLQRALTNKFPLTAQQQQQQPVRRTRGNCLQPTRARAAWQKQQTILRRRREQITADKLQ